jgi:hypothetical protein
VEEPVTEVAAVRLAHNESVFRSINERIEAGTWPASPSELVAFRCECAALRCNLLLEATVADYEAIRSDSRQFLVAPGHELPGIETVVEREPGYVVVRKVGDAGKVADATDPR